MVRTYNVSALTQSIDGTPPPKPAPPQQVSAPPPTEQYSSPAAALVDPSQQCMCLPSMFHSPLIDPIGSIVGLRVVYVEGKVCYIPVEPQVNYLINQQFGGYGGACRLHPAMGMNRFINWELPNQTNNLQQVIPPQMIQPVATSVQNANLMNPQALFGTHPNRVETPQYKQTHQVLKQTNNNNYEIPQEVANPSANLAGRMNDSWFPSNPQPKSGVRRSRDWSTAMEQPPNNYTQPNYTPTAARAASFAPITSISSSLPNLTNRGLSEAEQHKLDLQRQIEENRRRKEFEKQKEKEIEDREIRRHEEYMLKIKREEEEEKRKAKEKAQAAEIRRLQIHAEQQNQARLTRRRSPPREVERERLSTASSAAPRAVEWWEKKPTWQQKEDDRKSAVIPTLRGKPPAPPRTPSAGSRSVSRHARPAYDPASSAIEHNAETEDPLERAQSQRSISRQSRLSNASKDSSRQLNESYRSMSETEAKLRSEQDRVQSAISRNDYGEHVFEDSDGRPTAFTIR